MGEGECLAQEDGVEDVHALGDRDGVVVRPVHLLARRDDLLGCEATDKGSSVDCYVRVLGDDVVGEA